MIKWEYKRVTMNLSTDELDRFGREGWELVMIAGYDLIFKRPFIATRIHEPQLLNERVVDAKKYYGIKIGEFDETPNTGC